MKVLYIDHYAGSDSMGMEFRPHYLARQWRQAGIETIILAADYSHLRKNNPVIHEDLTEKVIDGSRFLFIKTKHYQGNGKDRVLSMMQFVAKGMRLANKIIEKITPDVVICSSTYPFDTYLGQKIARKTGAQLIHEIHDLWPLTPMHLGGYSKNHPFIRVMQAAENSAYRHSDVIVSVLPNVEPHVRSLGFSTSVVPIPNGLPPEAFPKDLDHLPQNEEVVQLIQNLKGQGKFVVAYAGGISLSNAMEDFVQAMVKLKDQKDMAAVIIGSGILKEHLEGIKKKEGLDQLYFMEPIAKKEVIGTLAQADALYLGSQKSPLYEYGVSANKIFDYLLAGLPIINAWDTNHSPLDYLGNTIKVTAASPEAIAQGMEQARKLSASERENIRKTSRDYVRKHHHYEELAKNFARLFKNK